MSAPRLLHDVLRRDDVADRLGHLPAVHVDQEAVGDDLPIRRAASRAQAEQQRALEPAAMLVAAFEIHVRRPRAAPAAPTARPRGSIRSRTRRRECSSPFRSCVPPHFGHVRPAGGSPRQAFRTRHRRRAARRRSAAFATSSGVVSASPHFVQSTAGIGTPQARWREMHQSGRLATMLEMRSWPHDGIHFTSLVDGVQRRFAERSQAVRRGRSPARRPSG